MNHPRFLWMLALPLAACGKDPPKPDPASASTAASTAAAPTPPAATTAAVTASAVAAPTPPPVAEPTTPEPSLKDWEATKLDITVVKNWDATGCVARRLREWVRVGCADSSKNGAPTKIEIVKGFPKAKLNNLEGRGGSMMLVFPAKPGLDGEATFIFEGATFRFLVNWPAGAPEPKPLGVFEEVAPPEAEQEPDSAPLKPQVSSDPLPEEPVVEGAPSAEAWATAREVGVKGSDALACETKQIGDWFRMVCRANDHHGSVTSAVAVRGLDEKKGYLITGNGAAILLTQYVKGTDIAIDITWAHTSARLTLKWPESLATMPNMRGEFVVSQKAQ